MGNVAPPINTTNVVLYFGGIGSDAYTASNDITGLMAKRIILTNSAAATQYIIGNSITLAGLTPEIQQGGTGGFVISNNLVLANNLTFDGTNTGRVEVDGTISGGYSLIMTGNYALVLGGANTYTGQTFIAQGQVVVANASALSNSVVNNQVAGGLAFSNKLTAATIGGLTGSVGLGLTNTAGTGLALTLNTVNAWTYSGTLSGSGSLTESGTGTGTLSGTNTYTGDTLVNNGTLTVSGTLASTNLTVTGGQFNWANTGAMTNTVAVSVSSGGTVNFSTDGTIDALTGNGRVIVSSNTLQVGFNNATTNFAGSVTGAGTLSKVGDGGTWTLTGSGSALSNVVVNNGTLALGGGSLTATNLAVNTGGNFALNTGTLTVNNAAISNNADFVVGNGLGAARLTVAGGTATFQNNLVVNNLGTLAGNGTIAVGGTAGVLVQNGGVISPGVGTGTETLTTAGTLTLAGGGQYLWDINSLTGTAGGSVGWDLLQVNGLLTNTANSSSPFVIDITSLTIGNGAGALTNFSRNGNYSFTIATASSGLTAFDPSDYTLNLAGFVNAYDGIWSLSVTGGTSLMLNYVGMNNLTWSDVSGTFSNSNNWVNGNAPTPGTTNLVLYFGGSTNGSYAATNDLTGLIAKQIDLTNNAPFVQYIVGNTIILAGVAPDIQQNGTGGFVFSNGLVLANNLTFDGTNTGRVEVDGTISGAYSLIKTGTYALVLGGSNTFSGSTIIQQGQVVVANANALSGSTVSNMINGGLAFSNLNAATVLGLTGTGNIGLTNVGIAGGGVALTLTGSGTYNGGLSGSGSLTKSGSGTETLAGNNTYTGDTLVNGATLTVSGTLASTNLIVTGGQFNWANTSAMTNAVAVTVNSGGIVNFSTSGTIDALTGNGQVNINANTLQVGFAGANTNFAGAISGVGTLSKVGSGTWTLTGLGNLLGNVAVNNGTLALSGGSLTATNFLANTGGQFALNTGTLTVNKAVISNGNDFVIGNGVGAATLNLLTGGTATFQNNLIVTNNGTLKGAANIVVAGGLGSVVIQTGGTLALGSTPGTMTITGNTVWQGGGQFVWDINNFAGSQGSSSGWDWLNVLGVLTNAATESTPFVIDVTSLNGSVAGLAANFNYNSNYTDVIASGSSIANFNTNSIVLNLSNFKNTYDGTFQLALQGTNLVLQYIGSDVVTWTGTGATNFSTAGNWINGTVPTAGRTNVVLYFGGSLTGYTASNDLNNLLTKNVVLTNNTSTVQTIDGNPFTFAGISPELDQNGSGGFVISNNITLDSTLTASGTGTGTVTLAGNVSDSPGNAGSITKNGTWGLVLGGSNTYSGATVVNSGTLFIANSYGLSGSTLSNVAGAVVITGNITNVYMGGLAGNVNLGLTNTSGAGVALAVGGNNLNSTYSGTLSGAGSLTKAGSGTLTLSGINTYSGATIVNSGTLIAGSLATGIGGGSGGSSLGTGNNIFINGGTLRFGTNSSSLLAVTNNLAGSVSMNGGTLQAASLVNFGHIANLGNTSTITSDLSNQGTLDVTGGTLMITGALFNVSGGIITDRATLTVGATGFGWVTNAGKVVMAGGTFNAGTINNSGTISGYGTLGALVSNTALVSAASGTLSIAGAATGAGAFRAEAGATLSFNGGGQISDLSNPNATIRIGGGILTNMAAFSNDGTLALAGGTYQANVAFTNNNWLVGYGTFSSTAPLVNHGTISANLQTTNIPLVVNTDLFNTGTVLANSSAMQVSGVFTNNGTLQFISSVGTYSRDVVNDGVWNTQNSSSTFSNNFIITTNGYVSTGISDSSKYVFKADLLNQSTLSNSWNTLGVIVGTNTVGQGVEFLFSGSSVTQTQTFSTPGLLLTDGFKGQTSTSNDVQDTYGYAGGFSNNFAIGQLWLTNTTLVLEQAPGITAAGALFVNDLDLFGGSQLIISNNMALYFVNSNGWTLADITLLGGASIHQLTGIGSLLVIPEPNVLLMWLCGGITVWAARRRTRRNRQQV